MSQSCCGFDSMVSVVRALGYAAISLSVYRGLPDWKQRAIRCPPLRSTLVVFGLLMSGLDLWIFKGLFSKPIARHRVSTARQVTAAWGFSASRCDEPLGPPAAGRSPWHIRANIHFCRGFGSRGGGGGRGGPRGEGAGGLVLGVPDTGNQIPKTFRYVLVANPPKPAPRNPNQL